MSPKQTTQRGFCGPKFHRLSPVNEEDRDFRSVSRYQRRVRVHVHFCQPERGLLSQPFAERSEIHAQVTPRPAIQFEAERSVVHHNDARTVTRSIGPVNAPIPFGCHRPSAGTKRPEQVRPHTRPPSPLMLTLGSNFFEHIWAPGTSRCLRMLNSSSVQA